MRFTHVALVAFCCAASCTQDSAPIGRGAMRIEVQIAPDAETLREIESAIALETMSSPEATCQVLELCPPPPKGKPKRPAKAAVTPQPEAQEVPQQAKVEPQPERAPERAVARPVPRPKGRAGRGGTGGLAPRAHVSPERAPREAPRSMVGRNVALGVGGTGLLVSAVTLGANVEARSDWGYAIGGVALGVGVIGLGTAGILTLMQDDDDKKEARVTPTGDGIRVRF
jgi:hypothetical protein